MKSGVSKTLMKFNSDLNSRVDDVLYNSSDGSLHYPTVAGVGERNPIVKCGAMRSRAGTPEERNHLKHDCVCQGTCTAQCFNNIRHVRILVHSR